MPRPSMATNTESRSTSMALFIPCQGTVMKYIVYRGRG
jgi:hypothetical protein